jgi:hypothetical protein
LIALYESSPQALPPHTHTVPFGKTNILVVRHAEAFVNGFQAGHLTCKLQERFPCRTAAELTARLFALTGDFLDPHVDQPRHYLYECGKFAGWLMTAAQQSDFFARIAQAEMQR